MQILGYKNFRKRTVEALDSVVNDRDILVIPRGNDNGVVIMSLSEYNSWMETMYLLRSDRNHRRIMDSIRRIENGDILINDLPE